MDIRTIKIDTNSIDQPFSVEYTKNITEIFSSISKASEYCRSSINQSCLSVSEALRTTSETIDNCLHDFFATFDANIKPQIEWLASQYKKVDWEALHESSIKWGEYGWIPPDGMSIPIIIKTPESLGEADKIALRYLDSKAIKELQQSLISLASKPKDVKEAIALFEERRYKPAAMLLCSLIDGQLITTARKPTDSQKCRRAKHTVKKISEKIPIEGISLMTKPRYALVAQN